MTIKVGSGVFNEIANTISELENLTAKPNLTAQEQRRNSFLLAKLSALKLGLSPEQIRNSERDRLLESAGLDRAPERGTSKLDEDAAQEWRKFATGQEFRATCVPPDREMRAYTGELAGTQTISYTQGAAGGYFVAPGMSSRLYQTMKAYDGIFDDNNCNVVETDTGGVTAFPIWDDVGNEAVQVGETSQSTEVEIASLSNTQLHAWSFRSKIVAVSLELATDANWDIGSVLEKIFGYRLSRGVGRAMITGNGVNAPTGLLTGAVGASAQIVIANGSSANDGSANTGSNSIGTGDIARLYAKLDPAYRNQDARFYMNDNTLQALNQLTDKFGHPIVDFSRGFEPSILGKPCVICPAMSNISAAANPVVFANRNYIIQRRVPSATYVRRFTQAAQLVEAGLIAFEMWSRFDSGFVSGNTSFVPAAVLQNHS